MTRIFAKTFVARYDQSASSNETKNTRQLTELDLEVTKYLQDTIDKDMTYTVNTATAVDQESTMVYFVTVTVKEHDHV